MSVFSFFARPASPSNAGPGDGLRRFGAPGLMIRGFGVGLAAGLVIAVFRISSDAAFSWGLRWAASHAARPWPLVFWAAALAGMALLTGILMRGLKGIRGSGRPEIERALRDGRSMPWQRILSGKFAGSWLVMAAGVSVGREGPCIQMGAAAGEGVARIWGDFFPKNSPFIIGGCAAGLAAAFSAPLAGIFFIFEKMRLELSARLLAFAVSSVFGVYLVVSRLFGLGRMLPFDDATLPSLGDAWTLVPLGVFAGAIGALFGELIHLAQNLYSRRKFLPERLVPLAPFLGAGIMILVYPKAAGEGLRMIRALQPGTFELSALLLFIAIKMLFTAFCFGSGIPAGLMVPVLCVGAVAGSIYWQFMHMHGLLAPEYGQTCVALGMAACFAAIERAPLTGIILVLEITGAYVCLPGVFSVAYVAAFTAKLLRARGI